MEVGVLEYGPVESVLVMAIGQQDICHIRRRKADGLQAFHQDVADAKPAHDDARHVSDDAQQGDSASAQGPVPDGVSGEDLDQDRDFVSWVLSVLAPTVPVLFRDIHLL